MNTWIVGKDLMNNYYLTKKLFTVVWTWKKLQTLIIGMQKKVFKNFNNKNLCDYHDLYVQSNTLLIASVVENFRKKCIEICELYSAHLLSAPGLACKHV